MADHPWIRQAVHLHVLGAPNKPAILCEGKHDHLFLDTMSKLFKIDLSGFTIIPTHGNTPHVSMVLELLHKLSPKERPIIVLVDKDFSVDPEIQRSLPLKTKV